MEFKQFAHMILNDDGTFYFNHIFGNRLSTEFCSGNSKSQVYEVTFVKDDNQEVHEGLQEYWGWFSEGRLSMVFPNHTMFKMCFPYGYEVEVKNGKGVALKLNILLFKNI